ncbi:SsrA-binding protein SmpB [Candidatus Parcubacteria bacterium]|nr:SsrA-binding protein SmpB [Candidatus Parcubacteria bacterium]
MTIYIRNKKIGRDYTIVEKFEAGIVLSGAEVKSIRKSDGSLDGSYVILEGEEVFLKNALVSPYQEKNTPGDYDPRGLRKLLVKKSEIAKIREMKKSQGLTILPIMLYNKGRNIKLEIAIAKGKKKHDKRESIKKRDQERDLGRSLK